MACVAALAGSSLAAAAPTARASTVSRSAVSSFSTSAPLAVRRSGFNGSAVRLSSRRAESVRFNPLTVRAITEETTDSSKEVKEFIEDLKAKWDKVENKTTVGIYAGGALVALWLSSTIVGAINSVPLVPKVLELVGLGYTGWFVYRYLLFKSSRKELVQDIEELKGRISGAVKDESL